MGAPAEIAIMEVPPEVIGSIRFPSPVSVAWFEVPSVKQVIELLVVMLLIVLVLTVEFAPLKLTDIGNTVPAPVLMLLKVFPVMLLTGPLVAEAPSVSLNPVKAEAPVRLTLEKLLLLMACEDPFTDEALESQTVVAPVPVRVNPVTIELLLIDSDAPEINDCANVKKIIVPVVFTEMLVNVFPFMLVESGLPD